jgi:hypothetical protein
MTDVQPAQEAKQSRKRARAQKQSDDEVRQPGEVQINFDDAVTEIKQIIAHQERDNWRLGEVAYHVEPRYGQNTLAKLAKANGGIAECTLRRRRNTYEAWFVKIRAAPPESFSVAQELQAHPDRAQIIAREPNITTRRARKLMREYKQNEKRADPDARSKEYHKWFNDAVNLANEAKQYGEIVDDKLDWERRQILCKGIEPKLLEDLREGGNALIRLADFLQQLLDEA